MTTFVTGGTGFIGEEVVRVLRAGGSRVLALARSRASADRLAALGAEVVEGDLDKPGGWRRRVADASLVVHAAQPPAWGPRKISTAAALDWESARLRQDAGLLEALGPGQRLVYVAGSSWFGHTGRVKQDESMTPAPCGYGPYLQRPLAQLAERPGLDVVVAYPSAVYGLGSWFDERIVRPLWKGRRLVTIWGADPWLSPIHVEDCARSLVHLGRLDAEALDALGRHVLLVDDEPMPTSRLVTLTAAALERPVRTLPVPGFLVGWLAGEIVRSYLASQSVYANARLRALGYALRWPTARDGIPAVVTAWKARRGDPEALRRS